MTKFRGHTGTDDHFIGGAKGDKFYFAVSDLNSLDILSGNGGIDHLYLTTAGSLGSNALAGMTGIEQIHLAAGGNGVTLKDGNFAGLNAGAITVLGGDGGDIVDGSALSAANALIVRAGDGNDVLKGGAGDDVFKFDATALAGDTIRGNGGIDTLVLQTAGALDIDALANMNGVERIVLSGGGNGVSLTDANFGSVAAGRIVITGQGGDDLIDAADLSGGRAVDVTGGLGADTLIGGEGSDRFIYNHANEFVIGETVDGGDDGYDAIYANVSMSFLGDGISNIDQITASNGATITISGENAVRLGTLSGAYEDGLTETFKVRLSGSQTADLSHLYLVSTSQGSDAGDSLTIYGTAGNETVTLGNTLLTFKGGDGFDQIHFGAFSHYGDGSRILGEGGDDRIDFEATSTAMLDGGSGSDTLVLLDAARINLSHMGDQSSGGGITRNFENVDASLAAAGVILTGRDDITSDLVGSASHDKITAGAAGAYITGGGGADELHGGAAEDIFYLYAGDVAAGETIDGAGGGDYLIAWTSVDLSAGAIINVPNLLIEGAGDVTVTMTGSQAQAFSFIGSVVLPSSHPAFVINMDQATLDLSATVSAGVNDSDQFVIHGTSADDMITGPGAASTILSGNGYDVVMGGGGDDVIGYSAVDVSLDGGGGANTLVFDPISDGSEVIGAPSYMIADLALGLASIVSYLSDGEDELEYQTYTNLANFNNADFSGLGIVIDLTGTDQGNILIGTQFGDSIAGAGGSDRLTGGGGGDFFFWSAPGDGDDAITDFTPGADRLWFRNFDFNGGGFDTVDKNHLNALATADLFVSTATLGDASAVRSLIDGGNGVAGEGLFIVARDANAHSILYYTASAGAGGADTTVYQIADLGAINPTGIHLGDFLFS